MLRRPLPQPPQPQPQPPTYQVISPTPPSSPRRPNGRWNGRGNIRPRVNPLYNLFYKTGMQPPITGIFMFFIIILLFLFIFVSVYFFFCIHCLGGGVVWLLLSSVGWDSCLLAVLYLSCLFFSFHRTVARQHPQDHPPLWAIQPTRSLSLSPPLSPSSVVAWWDCQRLSYGWSAIISTSPHSAISHLSVDTSGPSPIGSPGRRSSDSASDLWKDSPKLRIISGRTGRNGSSGVAPRRSSPIGGIKRGRGKRNHWPLTTKRWGASSLSTIDSLAATRIWSGYTLLFPPPPAYRFPFPAGFIPFHFLFPAFHRFVEISSLTYLVFQTHIRNGTSRRVPRWYLWQMMTRWTNCIISSSIAAGWSFPIPTPCGSTMPVPWISYFVSTRTKGWPSPMPTAFIWERNISSRVCGMDTFDYGMRAMGKRESYLQGTMPRYIVWMQQGWVSFFFFFLFPLPFPVFCFFVQFLAINQIICEFRKK